VLACPAFADDPPKDKKDATPKEQYAALVKEVTAKRNEILAEARKAKGEEQQKLFEKYQSVGGDYAAKFLKLAEDNPKDAVATDSLFWIIQNAGGGDAFKTATEKIGAMIAEAPLADLTAKLNGLRFAPPAVADAVAKRAEKEEKNPKAADLIAWVATRSYYTPAGQKAIKTLVEKYPDNPAIAQLCNILAHGGVERGDQLLKTILEKADKPAVKAAAAMGLGQALANKLDSLGDNTAEIEKTAADAEKYLVMAVDLYKDNADQKKAAEQELKALRTIRVGKEAPEIKGPDLDGKDFKLSDYRGKVVLLDFWGNW
jgi:hypothetical protein